MAIELTLLWFVLGLNCGVIIAIAMLARELRAMGWKAKAILTFLERALGEGEDDDAD